MKKRWLLCSLSATAGMLALAGWMTVSVFPLRAGAQSAPADDPGVAVEQPGGTLLHRAAVTYPRAAQAHRVQGLVTAELSLDENGNVSDARVLSGPEDLRAAVLASVLQWHYSKDMPLPAKVQVSVRFTAPETAPSSTGSRDLPNFTPQNMAVVQPPLKAINIEGLPDSAREALARRLPLKPGDQLTPEALRSLRQAVREFDEHLAVVPLIPRERDSVTLNIFMPGARTYERSGVPGRPDAGMLRVGGNVQQKKLIEQARPMYPPEAKAEGIQGLVRLEATVDKEGRVRRLTVVSGHPMLVPAAMEAVKTWVYEPTYLNGNPVEVVTQIDVNFTLAK